uniref:Uncharacterized protein n=1 Tax=Arundo donax TaxID=35708 RepID=A0A0A9GBC4_ARUDO
MSLMQLLHPLLFLDTWLPGQQLSSVTGYALMGGLHCLCHPLLLSKQLESALFQPADWDCKVLGSVQTAIQRTGLVQDSCLTGLWNLRKMKFLINYMSLGT